jgi:hypothetical protein
MQKLLPALLLPLALLATSQPTLAQSPEASPTAHLATRTVSGRVTDAQGQPLPGVTVLLKGTALGTSTDADGRYALAGVPSQRATLVFSFVGYMTRTLPAPAPGTALRVVLQADHRALSEVVITGYGTQKRQM